MHFLEYLIVRSALMALQCVSYEAALRAAAAIARFGFLLNARPRARAMANLELIQGKALGVAERERIALGTYRVIAEHIAEVAHVTRQRGRRLIIENGHIVQEAYARGRGVIAASAHMGPFVRMAMVPEMLGIRVAAVMKKQKNEILLEWGRDYVRRHFNIETFLKKDARGQIEGLLQQGYLVGLFADQHPRSGGFACTFFGRPVLAAAGPAIYAKRCDVPLVVVTAVRRGEDVVLRWEGPVSTEGTHEEISQRWMSILEARIREYPEQWTWMHRRWRDSAAPDIRDVAERAIATAR